MHVGYARSELLLIGLLKEVVISKQFDQLDPKTKKVIEEASWHLFRKEFSQVTLRTFLET